MISLQIFNFNFFVINRLTVVDTYCEMDWLH
jgi:hypothetical protein